jgi:purine-binding chemotaxis protein CheW
MQVREIRGWTPATPLPRTPSYMKGVINLRGAVLPIVDLGARLGLTTSEPSARHVIMVVNVGGRTLGLLVEAVSDIINVSDDMVQPTPDVACDQVKTFVKGLFAIDGRMVSLISLDRVLPETEAEAA